MGSSLNGTGVTFSDSTAQSSQAIHGFTATVTSLPAAQTPINATHSLGVVPDYVTLEITCLTAEAGYSPGDVIQNPPIWNGANGSAVCQSIYKSTTDVTYMVPSGFGIYLPNKTTAAPVVATPSYWSYRFRLIKTGT
jgi:hypothetical protein